MEGIKTLTGARTEAPVTTYEAGTTSGTTPAIDTVMATVGGGVRNMTTIEGHLRLWKVRHLGGNQKTCIQTVGA